MGGLPQKYWAKQQKDSVGMILWLIFIVGARALIVLYITAIAA